MEYLFLHIFQFLYHNTCDDWNLISKNLPQIIDHLKSRGKELESQLSECKAKIAEKQTAIIQQETELATVKFKSDQMSIQR